MIRIITLLGSLFLEPLGSSGFLFYFCVNLIILNIDFFQRPDLWTSAQLGTGSWMSQGDKSKLRQMYQCDGRKLSIR